ncbi:hypothetical protein N656DRAFT_781787 [Canariomyces notabilis]|uniref:Uncharacterized protein n=1 Tax=Canariomyces notabilis TaxID=2074819 RepID=A0AAN6TA76_9PEZI|nr:hypothetical protein N656DRAFT_781787 [Canariomyces arenarius]
MTDNRRHGFIAMFDRPYCPIPHFYQETWSYLSGNTAVLTSLPNVQAAALKRARSMSSPALPKPGPASLGKGEQKPCAGDAPIEMETLKSSSASTSSASSTSSTSTASSSISLPSISDTSAFTPFREMVGTAISLSSSLPTVRPAPSLTRQPTPPPPQNRRRPITDRVSIRNGIRVIQQIKEVDVVPKTPPPPATSYDGLRSCPPTSIPDRPGTWRPYRGPLRRPPKLRRDTRSVHDMAT